MKLPPAAGGVLRRNAAGCRDELPGSPRRFRSSPLAGGARRAGSQTAAGSAECVSAMFTTSLIGGEIHYGRLQQRYWGACLDAARQLGAETIGMYVMWELHEQREGEYDFAALHAFLAAVEQRGLKVVARPGPFFYAEWRNLGIPDHAVPYPKGHPEFRRRAARWIAAAMAELQPYLGRLIVAVQADNEIDPMPHFWGEDQGFADWLRRRYGSIERLNDAWATGYAGFAEPIPWLAAQLEAGCSSQDRASGVRNRIADSCQYRYDLATDYARWVVAEYRRCGCSVPILLNTWPGVDAQNWHDFQEIADFFGIDPYPTNECRTDFRCFRERLRLLRCVSRFPYIAEFGAGVWHGADPAYSAEHYRLTALTALASGVRGWNWYMLVNRDNWSGAPINERGVIRPELGDVFSEAIRDFKALEHAPPPATSFSVTWSWRYHQRAQIAKREADDPLFAALHELGVEYDFVDVDHPFVQARDGQVWPKLLLAAGDIAEPDRLWDYVERGGKLVVFQRLIDGCAIPDGTSHAGAEHLEVTLPGAAGQPPVSFVTHKPVLAYRHAPGAAIVARQLPWRVDEDQRRLMQLAVGRTYTTGYVEPRGRGVLMVLGTAPSAESIRAAHAYFGIPLPVLPLTPGVHATRRGERLIVLNPGEAKAARLLIDGVERFVELPRCGGVIL